MQSIGNGLERVEFSGKVVLVTGAGRGAGRSIAQAFAAHGAIVAANDLTPINLDETIALIHTAGGQVKAYIYDVAKRMPVQALVEEVLDDWDRIDILVNCANVVPHAALLDMDEWDWQRTLDVNLSGPFYTMQQVGRAMREQGGGVIINLGAGQQEITNASDRAAYAASKSGLVGLTQAATQEFVKYNIRVNLVLPAAHVNQDLKIAHKVLYLCSREAAHLTGQVIDLD